MPHSSTTTQPALCIQYNSANTLSPHSMYMLLAWSMLYSRMLRSLISTSAFEASYQYVENIWNFLKASEELKLPAFEALDLERCLVVEKGGPIKGVSATSLFYSWASILVAYGSIPVPQTFAVDFRCAVGN
ncbi:hypothetical protein RND81_09G073700 [Saponaria officinalis]|uniref:Uncharacterized protein n=2 Tax=Saponaria officinalis TaxID=3572 RepID=A0AAW1IJ10_SAPOF